MHKITYDVGFSNCLLSNGLSSASDSPKPPFFSNESFNEPAEIFVSGNVLDNGDGIPFLEY